MTQITKTRLNQPAALMAALSQPDMARIPLAMHLSGLSRSRLYILAGEGHIRFVKIGNATLVDMASVRSFLAALPPASIRPAAAA